MSELESAQKAILSAIRKSEKVQATLSLQEPSPTPQLTMVSQRLKVLQLALSLITRVGSGNTTGIYSKEDLIGASTTLTGLIRQIEKVMPKFKQGTSQHTLAVRRIRAFEIASALIDRELSPS
ncbi:hypothetical protein Dform_00064 [Dehalogenimonas formicexedens]|uniref:Uncharacterized protein n=1 Tax=Dehalogenimonas formicexedens TaxID=1839801 RepID=A0A1P8F4M7_9CHLR|nr:hypothetical protein Dform_00064 [Dehalogenimonas formicexedens]